MTQDSMTENVVIEKTHSWSPGKDFETVHRWIGPWPPPLADYEDMADNVLCFKVDPTMTLEKVYELSFTVTDENSNVTCQECNELAHA